VYTVNQLKSLALLLKLVFAALICTSLCACDRDSAPTGGRRQVTIAIATLPEAALAQVAQSQGYFAKEGLDVTVKRVPYGKISLQEVLDGKADIATVAETPVMFAIMNGAKISVIATIATSDTGHAIVARRDRGIGNELGDLKGKRIGVTQGTTSEFFLDTMLASKGIPRKAVEIVEVKAENIPDALARGDVDAISAFAPFNVMAQKRLGAGAVTFHDRDIYRYSFNIVATQEYVEKNGDVVRRVLRSLLRSERFTMENPSEAQAIVTQYSGLKRDIVGDIWSGYHYAVGLDQTLVLGLEDEMAWAVRNGAAKAATTPNFLDYIDHRDLTAVKPEAVEILR
jgi:ABC-type nitrate/sulfonate/bicarbonate transport system substrate-binding protein